MNIKEIMEIIDRLENRISNYWNFYIIIVLAIVGWLMSGANPFKESQYIVLVSVFILFSLLNTYMIFETTKKIYAWKGELKERVTCSDIVTNMLKNHLVKRVTKFRLLAPVIIHFIIDFSILYAIYSKYQ